MDIVTIRALQVDTLIGVYEWERTQRRPLLITLDMGWDTRPAAQSDDLGLALDYAAVANRVRGLCQSLQVQLIETLAERVADCVQAEFGVPWIRVSVEKAGAVLHAAHVAVVIERGQRGR